MLNRCFFMGRLTKDPELRYTNSQKPVATFTIAVDRDFNRDETDFINCVAWNKTADFVNSYFKKGQMVVVTGRLQNRDYTDKDGNNRRATEIICDNVYFGEAKRGNSAPDKPVLVEVEDDGVNEPLPF